MLHFTLNMGDSVPIYRQIMRQIQHLIATGRLRQDDELPPVRTLAERLVINPNTVARAYRELEVAGLVYKRRGAGTYVASGNSPYTEEERRRILTEHVDGLLVESRNLGFSLDDVVGVLRNRDAELARPKTGKGVA